MWRALFNLKGIFLLSKLHHTHSQLCQLCSDWSCSQFWWLKHWNKWNPIIFMEMLNSSWCISSARPTTGVWVLCKCSPGGSNTFWDTGWGWKMAEPFPLWFPHLLFTLWRKAVPPKEPAKDCSVCVRRILRNVMFCHSPSALCSPAWCVMVQRKSIGHCIWEIRVGILFWITWWPQSISVPKPSESLIL